MLFVLLLPVLPLAIQFGGGGVSITSGGLGIVLVGVWYWFVRPGYDLRVEEWLESMGGLFKKDSRILST